MKHNQDWHLFPSLPLPALQQKLCAWRWMIPLTRLLPEVARPRLTPLAFCLGLVANLWHVALSQDLCMHRKYMQYGPKTCCCVMLCL